MVNKKPRCTYCGKPVRNKYSFSYGVPGVVRVFGCDRLGCRIFRRRLYRLKKRALYILWSVGDAIREFADRKLTKYERRE